MVLPQVGLSFIAANADDFIDVFNKVAGNVAIAVEQVQKFADNLNPIGGRTDDVIRGIDGANTSFQNFDWTAHTLSNTIANVLADALETVISKLSSIPKEAEAAVSAMQDMEITLETLVAGDVISSGTTEEMSEALEAAVPIVDNLMLKLEELAVASPFRYQQILSVFQMNKSFGMATDMAFETTRAITNLASTMKGVPGITQRLSYNFSQMALTGKIMGRDLRDLRMAGLDLEKVFQKQLGKTVKEVNADLASGAMVFDDVSKAFVAYVDKYIGPAAERASRTLGGLKSTIADIQFFAFGNLFKSTGDAVAEGIGTILDALLKILRSDAMKEMGVVLGVAADTIFGYATTMFKPLLDAADDFDKNMAGKAEAAFDWGLNIIESLADGIISGMGYLADAMVAIGGLLANWLMGHSPPKVAPDIDKWGLDAAREWLIGFTQVDYSILNAIQSPLKQALSTLSSIGMLKAGDSDKMFADLSKSIMAALSGEKDFGSVINEVHKAAGPFGEDISKLTALQFAYVKAIDDVTEAEKRLVDAQKAEISATGKVYDSVKEYNDLLRSGASKKVLKDKLDQINAAKKEQVAARENRNLIGEQYSQYQQNAGAIQEQIGIQQKLVESVLELANAYNSAENAQKNAAKAAATSPKIPTTKMPTVDDTELQQKLDALKNRLEAKVAETMNRIYVKFRDGKTKILTEWYLLKEKILSIWDAIETIFQFKIPTAKQIDRISSLFGIDEGKINEFLDNISNLRNTVITIFRGYGDISGEEISSISKLFGMDEKKTQEIIDVVSSVVDTIRTIITDAPKFITPILNALLLSVIRIVSMAMAVFQTLFTRMGEGKKSSDGTKMSLQELGIAIAGIIEKIGIFVSAVILVIGTVVQAFLTMRDFLQSLYGLYSSIINTLLQLFATLINIWDANLKSSVDQLINIIKSAWLIIVDIFTTGGKNIGQIISDWWNNHKRISQESSDRIKKIFSDMWNRIKEIWSNFAKTFLEFWNNLVELVLFVPRVKKHFEDNMSAIVKAVGWVREAFAKLKDFLSGIKWPEIKIPLPDVGGILDGITDALEGFGGDTGDSFIGESDEKASAREDKRWFFPKTDPIDDLTDSQNKLNNSLGTTSSALVTTATSYDEYVSSVQNSAITSTNALATSISGVDGGLSALNSGIAQTSSVFPDLDNSIETATGYYEEFDKMVEQNKATHDAWYASQVTNAEQTKSALGEMASQYDNLKGRMDAWLNETAGQVVNVLGQQFSQASDQYRAALEKVDSIMGTNYVKQLEAKDAVERLVQEYGKTENLDDFEQGLIDIKEQGLADMQSELDNVVQKAEDLYTSLLNLPSDIKIDINLDIDELPGWLRNASGTGSGSRTTGMGAGTRAATANKPDDPQEYATGGRPPKNKPVIVGEEGPEWFIPPNSGRILPNHMPLPAKYIGGTNRTEITNTVEIDFGGVTISNAQEGTVFEQRVERAVRKALGG